MISTLTLIPAKAENLLAEELAAKIGPISTYKDRIQWIKEFFAAKNLKQVSE